MKVMENIDYIKVHKMLKVYRETSIEFLNGALL